MEHNDLLTIAKSVLDEAVEKITYSANRPNLYDQPFHRFFWMQLVRKCNPQLLKKNRHFKIKTRKTVREWAMDLSKDEVDSAFKNKKVTQVIPYTEKLNPTLDDWFTYISQLPERNLKKFHADQTPVTPHEKIESIAKNSVKYGIGNCFENACYAFARLLEVPNVKENIYFEMMRLPQEEGDHAFIVLNRKAGSNMHDVTTWGNAIILDPWMNAIIEVQQELLLPMESRQHCLNYIGCRQKYLMVGPDEYGFIGQGHTERWIAHREKKKEPVNLKDWPTFYKKNSKENVPWCAEETKSCPVPQLKRKLS